MLPQPSLKRTVAFVDGQNLFHAAREAFGCTHPNYDVSALARAVCDAQSWSLTQTRFYTGIPDAGDDPFWHSFWSSKLAVMGRQGAKVFSHSLRYRNRVVRLPDGRTHSYLAGEEKGIDVRIALDIIRMAAITPECVRSTRRLLSKMSAPSPRPTPATTPTDTAPGQGFPEVGSRFSFTSRRPSSGITVIPSMSAPTSSLRGARLPDSIQVSTSLACS
jgi:hypothetical protein